MFTEILYIISRIIMLRSLREIDWVFKEDLESRS